MRLTILFFTFSIFSLFGQYSFDLDTINLEQRKQYAKKFNESNERLIKQIKNEYSRKIARPLLKDNKEFVKEFEKTIIEGEFLFDKRFLTKATEILNELKTKNSNIPKHIDVLISKNPSLNAFCLPDGTFVLNLGLFYWLDNENQLASIMAHEISHKLLEHSINSQVELIKEQQSKKVKKKVKDVRRSRYNKQSKALELYRNQLYSILKNRRTLEIEADSLGYLLLQKTKYNVSDYIETLKLMEKYDTIHPKDLKKSIYRKVFDLPNQKFKEEWLINEDFSNYNYDLYKGEFDKDSISTHPEVKERIEKLITLDPSLKDSKTSVTTQSFKGLNKLAEYNLIPSLMYYEEYGLSIYICLTQIQKENNIEYYKKLLGENFIKILEGRKKYQLNRYLHRVDPKDQSESYIQFLNFMWNLSLTEIEVITDYYTNIK